MNHLNPDLRWHNILIWMGEFIKNKVWHKTMQNGFSLEFYCDINKPTPSQKQLEKAPKIYGNKRLTMARDFRFYVT